MKRGEPSDTYRLLAHALENHVALACSYNGHARVICPIILGHRNGEEVVLAFQVAGRTSGGPLREPEWKCLRIARMRDFALSDHGWSFGRAHGQAQHCVAQVDYDANPDSPYALRRSLGDLTRRGG